jgi:hypothetical protein
VNLTGCAGIKPIEPKAEQLQAIRSIAVVSGPELASYSVLNFGHPAYALGALGGAIVAADQNQKQARLAQVLQPLAPATAEQLSQAVVANLQRMGYDAHRAQASWKKADANKSTVDLRSVTGNADAVLVLEPQLTGFVATPGKDYLPTVQTEVRLYGKEGSALLLHAKYGTGWTREDLTKYTATHQPPFKTFDALVADPSATAQSLDRAANLLASA